MMKYDTCEHCGSLLELVWFIEEETEILRGYLTKTGRKRLAVDVLVCPTCFREYTVDDSMDRPWRKNYEQVIQDMRNRGIRYE